MAELGVSVNVSYCIALTCVWRYTYCVGKLSSWVWCTAGHRIDKTWQPCENEFDRTKLMQIINDRQLFAISITLHNILACENRVL